MSGEGRARRRWARLQERLAIAPGTEMAGRFAGFGEGSVIEGPQLHVTGEHAMRVGSGVTILKLACLEAYAPFGSVVLEIGDDCYLSHNIRIVALNGVRIAHKVAMGQYVTVTDTIHDYKRFEGVSWEAPLLVGRPLEIDTEVWVGVGTVIVGGVRIGEKAIIGPNSVITRDVPAGAMVSGNPARIVKQLQDGQWVALSEPRLLGEA
jgi:acetyltransferase-like isoleucine patch superfamily enzyme